eukprot:GHVU01040852.1.p1 GENE.GHVU01040852.1~~GHVU01040852.1.p1  ORF type:complete len:151 (-),score=16.23 GHVU01040852.1:1871-2323(-)
MATLTQMLCLLFATHALSASHGLGPAALRKATDVPSAAALRNLSPAGLLKFYTFFIPGPYEDEETVTPIETIANSTALVVEDVRDATLLPYYKTVTEARLNQKIDLLKQKTEVVEARNEVALALIKLKYIPLLGPDSFDRLPEGTSIFEL